MKRSHALFDIAVLAVYLLAANPALTGIPLHEFLGSAPSSWSRPMWSRAGKVWAAAGAWASSF